MKNIVKSLTKLWLIMILIIIVIFVLLFLKPKGLEKKMEDLVRDYYETNVMGKVVGVDKQIVTLKNLADSNYDISGFKKCNQESYSYVIIENPLETDKTKIKYTIENHLTCD